MWAGITTVRERCEQGVWLNLLQFFKSGNVTFLLRRDSFVEFSTEGAFSNSRCNQKQLGAFARSALLTEEGR